MDAAEYKHVVLGLIFLKYISDAFEERRAAVLAEWGEDADEDRDEYVAENVFWVPAEARWTHLRAPARQPTVGLTVDLKFGDQVPGKAFGIVRRGAALTSRASRATSWPRAVASPCSLSCPSLQRSRRSPPGLPERRRESFRRPNTCCRHRERRVRCWGYRSSTDEPIPIAWRRRRGARTGVRRP